MSRREVVRFYSLCAYHLMQSRRDSIYHSYIEMTLVRALVEEARSLFGIRGTPVDGLFDRSQNFRNHDRSQRRERVEPWPLPPRTKIALCTLASVGIFSYLWQGLCTSSLLSLLWMMWRSRVDPLRIWWTVPADEVWRCVNTIFLLSFALCYKTLQKA